MGYIEIYNDNILDLVNLGKTVKDFNESMGDYIKVEIYNESNTIMGVLYSNRLLLRYSEADKYHTGEYHFHPENTEMGFCTNRIHTDKSISQLKPIVVGDSIDEPLNSQSIYKRQVDIFKDDKNQIYIKPNEIIRLLGVGGGKYKVRIYFLRNIKSSLGNYFGTMKNNLIENGNFFAGLEATQTGDLDKSSGKNTFYRMANPGFSPHVLHQNGLPGNEYNMRVTGIKANTSYVFSCWVAWDEKYDGHFGVVSFSNVSSKGPTEELIPIVNTDLGGSYVNTSDDRILKTKNINGIIWHKLYAFVQTGAGADLGSIWIHVGRTENDTFKASMNPLGSRYFTDLRFEKVDGLVGTNIDDYLMKLKTEINNTGNEFKYLNAESGFIKPTSISGETADAVLKSENLTESGVSEIDQYKDWDVSTVMSRLRGGEWRTAPSGSTAEDLLGDD